MTAEIGAITQDNREVFKGKVGEEKEIQVWDSRHESNPPPGSHSGSLLVFEGRRPVRVAGPTHYHHLADGRVVGGYSGGTHYSEAVEDGPDKITRIVATHEG
jgi:hypothetical protein